MANNNRSRNVTQGVARSANRAMYYAMGYKDEDFDKPMVGVANGHSTITPCNSGLQKLADAAIAAIADCNANSQVFGTPTVSDGIGMGTEGMKYSLVSREVIADCIETCVNGQWMDGVIVIGGCDKNMPGGMMAIARCNVPSIYVYGGTVKPGHYKGKDLTIVSAFEAVGEFTAGRLNETDFKEVERRCIPGSGSCGGMYTANTMSSSFEALGMSLLYSSTQANPDQDKVDSTAEAARVLVDAIRKNLLPSDIITRKSIENAVSLIMAVGGSTNAVLHFLAIAHSAGIPWTIDDFETIRRKVPVLCDLKPSGRYVATDLHRAGGVPQVLKILLANGLLHGDCMTITGKTVAEILAGKKAAIFVGAVRTPYLVDAIAELGMKVDLIGMVENMSYFVCPHCQHEVDIFSRGGAEKTAAQFEVPFLGGIQLDPDIRRSSDSGSPTVLEGEDSPHAKSLYDFAKRVIDRVDHIQASAPQGVIQIQ